MLLFQACFRPLAHVHPARAAIFTIVRSSRARRLAATLGACPPPPTPFHLPHVHRVQLHFRALVSRRCALHPHAPRQDLRGGGGGRGDCGRQASVHCHRPGADSEHGREDRAGARLSAAGQRAVARQGARAALRARPAHHRRSGARFGAGSRWPVALRDRGRLQPGAAQHAHGGLQGAGDFGQLPHRAADGHHRRCRFQAHRPGAQGGRGGHHAQPGCGGAGADFAVRLFAHGRGLQPGDGRSRHLGRHGAAGRQADLSDRKTRYPRASAGAGIGRQPDRHRDPAGRSPCADPAPAAARRTDGRRLLPEALRDGVRARRGTQPHPALRGGRRAAAGGLRARRHRHHGGR